MDEKRRLENPDGSVGIDFHFTDGQNPRAPDRYKLEPSTSHAWFEKHPSLDDEVNYKILSLRINRRAQHEQETFSIPFNAETVEHAFWKSEVYANFVLSAAGGASILFDEPPRFILQSPRDDGPFFSLAMSKRGNVVKGIYVYDHDDFEPTRIASKEISVSGWRQSGMQIISLPTAILRAHSKYLSTNLADVIRQIKSVETSLADPASNDFGAMGLSLHTCSNSLINLERRSRFEQAIVDAVEATVGKYYYAKSLPWAYVAAEQSSIKAREFDFESLPRRIHDARMTISGLIQQRNEMMNLEIAQASRRMTEIALSDNASMKTIAIMTMIFLPGTAVASFFSMAMFNWSATDGSQIASRWLWVYFVCAVPLTAMVIVVWWIWSKRAANRTTGYNWGPESNVLGDLEDIELISQPRASTNVSRTVTTGPNK